MARNRMIKPEFWEDSKIAQLPFQTRLFFIATWNFADDEGYITYDKEWLKVKCCPYDEANITEMVDFLIKLDRFDLKNGIILIKNFLKYQKIQHPTKSELKAKFMRTHEDSRALQQMILQEKLREVKIREVNISKEKENDTKILVPKNGIGTVHQKFVSSFKNLYKQKTGYPYKSESKDFVIASKLIKEFSIEVVVEKVKILAEHCELKDLWFTKDGWCDFTISKLSQFFNKLLPLQSAPKTDWAEIFKQKEKENVESNTIA